MTRDPGGAGGGPGTGEGAGSGDGIGPSGRPSAGIGPSGRPSAGAGLHIVRFAPAKLNLTLAVVGRRDDGYHSLHSVMVPLLLGDALTVSVAPQASPGDTLRVSGLAVSAAEDNMVLRAIAAVRAALAREYPRTRADLPPLSVRLVKRIPVAAGLGGGSSDAAAAIEAALAAWQTTLPPASKAAVAASLGSDVPFFLAQGAALITGRGEFVEPLPDMDGEPPAVLLVTPGLPVSTSAVFGAYAAGARPADATLARGISESLAARFQAGTTTAALLQEAQNLSAANDLLPATISLAPDLEMFIRELQRIVGRPVCQSGSGPTQWVIFATLAEARKAVRLVRLAVARGSLPTLGEGDLFAVATAIAGPFAPPAVQLHDQPDGQPVVRSVRANRPRTVHNGPGADAHPQGSSAGEPLEPKGDDSR
jgi:4-diphosphocytidyl-2-C-methyl-D-erythritol kinase